MFVTGGAGFLGGLLIDQLLQAGHSVTSVDLLPATKSHINLKAVVADIRDTSTMRNLLTEAAPEIVFHCAAKLAHVAISQKELWSCNVHGTASLADAMIAVGVSRIVFISSNCLWGVGFDRPVSEDEPPAPVEIYGLSKLEAEKQLEARSSKLCTTIIRSPTIIDEGRLGLLAILFEFIDENRRVWTVGGGENRYQFIYAADLIDAMLTGSKMQRGNVYGIGSDGVGTLRENFQYVIDHCGSNSTISTLPKGPALAAMRLSHFLGLSPLGPYHYNMIASNFVFDTTRIKQDLGWRPTLTNGEMLLKAYRFYHLNRAEISMRTGMSAHRSAARMGVIRLLKWVS